MIKNETILQTENILNNKINSSTSTSITSLPSSNPSNTSNNNNNNNNSSSLSSSSSSSSSSSLSSSNIHLKKFSEISPNKRYIRFDDIISQDGNIKYSFKAFDTTNGIEIVWQKIILSDLSSSLQYKISNSANYLKEVRHQHILEYLDIWLTETPRTLNLITRYLDSLKQFIDKIGGLRWRIVKKWCKQILRGLAYLHNHNPQIIHRNLTWKNIFVNPGLGELYVGGMWLAAIIEDTPISVSDALSAEYIGSPSYRAPEMSESSSLTTKVDIYSFGMSVLAMVTRDEPYSEYQDNFEKIINLASQGILPLGLKKIDNTLCVDFIQKCICLNPNERLSVEQLLEHPFLQPNEENDEKEVSLLSSKLNDYHHHHHHHQNNLEKSSVENHSIEKTQSSDLLTKNQSVPLSTVSSAPLTSLSPSLRSNTPSIQTEVINTIPVENNHIQSQSQSQSQSIESHTKQVNKESDSSVPLFPLISPADRPPRHPSPALTQSHSDDGAISRTTPYLFPRDALSNDLNSTPSIESESLSLSSSIITTTQQPSSIPPLIQPKQSSDTNNSEKNIPHDNNNNNNNTNYSNKNINKNTEISSDQKEEISDLSNSLQQSQNDHPQRDSTDSGSVSGSGSGSVQVRVCSNLNDGFVTVQLRLGEGETADGIIKDVEFLFNIENDNYDVVAAEMKQELNLTIPTEHLSILIQNQVDAVLKNIPNQSKAVSSPSKTTNNNNSNNDNNIEVKTNDSSKESKINCIVEVINLTTYQNPELSLPSISTSTSVPTSAPALNDSPNQNNQSNIQNNHPLIKDVHSLSQDSSESLSPRGEISNNDTNTLSYRISGGNDDSHLKSEDVIESSDLVLLQKDGSNNSNNSNNNKFDDFKISSPDDDATAEELSDFTELLREIEKIDKECRAAKRVFEQRIQKHKITQESCEEEMKKIELDYVQQCQQIEKSESKMLQKREENLQNAKLDFESKVSLLRESQNTRKRIDQSSFSIPPDHPVPIDSINLSHGSINSSSIVGPERTFSPPLTLGTSGVSNTKDKS